VGDPVTDVFVVADAHGRLDLVEGLLALAGAERGPSRTIVHLGDLVNCVASSIDDDLATLEAAPDLFDVLLCGNHEHPYFGGPTFSGFFRSEDVATAMLRLPWKAAFAAGEFLVTHAGLGRALVGGSALSARAHANILNRAWADNPGRDAYFAAISRYRGGLSEVGGILWSDWQEPKSTAGFSQIVGHTPGPIRVQGQPARVRDMKVLGRDADDARFTDGRPDGFEPGEHFALGIDLGASKGGKDYADPHSKKIWPRGDRLAGCWIRDGLVEVVVYTLED
jgi:hypothetical protein